MEPVHAHPGTLWTIGHSTRPWEVFVDMLREAGITQLVDVRRFVDASVGMNTPHIPRWRTIMEWRRNYAPLAPGQHAGNVDLDVTCDAL